MRELLRISQDPLSLDSPVGEEDESNLADFIKDDTIDGPADAAAKAMLHEAVEQVLGELTEREQEIVRMRFGLDGGQAKTLEEVGKAFGVTRERIRQIEAKTLAKLRHPQRCNACGSSSKSSNAATPPRQNRGMGYGGKYVERAKARRAARPGLDLAGDRRRARRRQEHRVGLGERRRVHAQAAEPRPSRRAEPHPMRLKKEARSRAARSTLRAWVGEMTNAI